MRIDHCVKSVQIHTRKNPIFVHFSRSEHFLQFRKQSLGAALEKMCSGVYFFCMGIGVVLDSTTLAEKKSCSNLLTVDTHWQN